MTQPWADSEEKACTNQNWASTLTSTSCYRYGTVSPTSQYNESGVHREASTLSWRGSQSTLDFADPMSHVLTALLQQQHQRTTWYGTWQCSNAIESCHKYAIIFLIVKKRDIDLNTLQYSIAAAVLLSAWSNVMCQYLSRITSKCICRPIGYDTIRYEMLF